VPDFNLFRRILNNCASFLIIEPLVEFSCDGQSLSRLTKTCPRHDATSPCRGSGPRFKATIHTTAPPFRGHTPIHRIFLSKKCPNPKQTRIRHHTPLLILPSIQIHRLIAFSQDGLHIYQSFFLSLFSFRTIDVTGPILLVSRRQPGING
jgi:hypothetical protein